MPFSSSVHPGVALSTAPPHKPPICLWTTIKRKHGNFGNVAETGVREKKARLGKASERRRAGYTGHLSRTMVNGGKK